MMRIWIGLALLAGSWLFGQSYFAPPSYAVWACSLAAAAALMAGAFDRLPSGRIVGWSVVLLLPTVVLVPMPEGVGLLTLLVGLGLATARAPRRWIGSLGRGAVAAGVVLCVQALALSGYAAYTARSHDLPGPFVWLLTGLAKWMGADAAADGPYVAIHTMRETHRLAATWELFFDPATLCFYVGGLALLGLLCWAKLPARQAWSGWIAALRRLTAVVIVWLPVRAALLMAVYVHRAVRYDESLPLHVMNHFFSPWVLLGLLAVPVLLAWRFVRLSEPEGDAEAGEPGSAPVARWRLPAAAGLVLVGVGLLTAAVYYDPIGSPKGGRVMFVERHSEWEPTDRPYDTTWYGHDSGYNYAAAYDYLGQYYDMSRLLESDAIDDQTLARCDVLVIKTPTARYSRTEVDAVVRFVEAGGGVLFIGDHTNYARMGTYMNDITRYFGFTFRDDLLFSLGESPYRQRYRAPWAAHPAVQHVPPMDFAVSCSIDPGRSRGRAAIESAGLFSLPPDYHIENFHTIPQHRPDMRFGAFIQLWSTRHGRGRVLAFTDSTIFSNFCVYQPGKIELLRGMVDWLNYRDTLGDPRRWLAILGIVPIVAGVWFARSCAGAWLLLLASAACGFAVFGQLIASYAESARPIPETKRPIPRVVIDRTTSAAPLGIGPDVEDPSGEGFAMLEKWIPRLGCYTTRQSDDAAFSGDLLVILCPDRSVSAEFRDGLQEYVAEGGKLLLIESPENNPRSTADSLLWPFDVGIYRGQAAEGPLKLGKGWPEVPDVASHPIAGGRPVAHIGEQPVAAVTDYGEGRVMAVGFGALFSDRSMANDQPTDVPWMIEPDEETLKRYEVLYALVGSLLFDRPIEPPEAP